MTKTLYVTDLDGTLLDNNSRVSDHSAEILSRLSGKGLAITVATARTPATVDPLMATSHLSCKAIVMTGAAMWDFNNKMLTDIHLLSKQETLHILSCFEDAGLDPFIYIVNNPSHLDVFHGTEMNRFEDAFYQERRHLQLKKFHIGSSPGEDQLKNTILLFAIGDASKINPLAQRLRFDTRCSISNYPDLNNNDVALIEIFAPGVSKATAVNRLAAKIGADRVVVFGDNYNDIPMMEIADLAVAVDNAFPAVKEQADITIGPNSADSVACFIEKDNNRVV